MQINQYYIYKNKLIGKGQHSYVYICQDINTSIFYAIKIKHTKYMNNEIQLLKRINSKYIVTVYEIITIKNESYIIMELMQNNSLNVNLFELDIFCIWKYFRNLISAVEHCHEIGKIIHHNISLRNCLINDDDVLKLTNFSCGLVLNEEDNITVHLNENVVNQQSVIPPPEECFLIGERDVDGRAVDIWLMGNVLYSLVMRKSFISSQNNTLTPKF
jgi:serine/threonine protein kinase